MCLREPDFRPMQVQHLAGLRNCLSASDFVVANLETPITDRIEAGRHHIARYRFVSPVALAEQVKAAGVTHVSVANNHCLDQGFDGLMETLDCLRLVGLTAFGAKRCAEDAAYAVVEKDGLRVGLSASTYGTNTLSNQAWLTRTQRSYLNMHQNQELSHPWVRHLYHCHRRLYRYWLRLTNREASDWFDRKELSWSRRHHLAAEMRCLREKEHCDVVVAYPHVGGQHRREPMESVQSLYRWMFRHGVDAVIGNHEHLVQRSEWVRGRFAAYCLGNTVSYLGLGPLADDKHENCSVILHQYVDRDTYGKTSIRYTFSLAQTYVAAEGDIRTRPMHELIAESRSAEERAELAALLNTIGSRFLGQEWRADDAMAAEHSVPEPK